MNRTDRGRQFLVEIGLYALTIGFLGMIGFIIWCANTGHRYSFMKFGTAFPYADKLAHFLLIGGATLLINLSLRNRRLGIFGRDWLVGSLVVFLTISIEETSQQFIPGRTFDWLDLSANYAGIFCFGLLAKLIRKSNEAAPDRFV